MFLEFLLAQAGVSGAVVLGVRHAQKRADLESALLGEDSEPRPTPFLDKWLQGRAGEPASKNERMFAETLITTTRALVNRKAFDYLVHGAVNSNSSLHALFDKAAHWNGKRQEHFDV